MRGFFGGSTFQRNEADYSRGLRKCGACKFATDCTSPRIATTGDGGSQVLLIGEHPGEREDKLGKHFAGDRVLRLKESLQDIGESYKATWQTSAMICKPNEKGWSDKNIAYCRPGLLTEIDQLKPKVIILLGPAAIRAVMPAERGGAVGAADRWYGFNIPSKQFKAWLCPVFSINRVLEFWDNPITELIWHRQLRQAFDLVDKPVVAYSMKELQDKVELIYSPRQARLRLRDLRKKKGRVAFDYESNCLKPELPKAKLLACSFCHEGEDTFSFLIKNDDRLLKELALTLRHDKFRLIASNMKNEHRWTKSKLKVSIKTWWHDTMIASHIIDKRKNITSIKFQVFLYFGVPDYDRFVEPFIRSDKDGYNKLETMDPKDLLQYNGMDSLVEYMVAIEQRKALGMPL